MGEYAIYKGQQIKIGTCEDMYYLRADQAHLVTPMHGSVHPIKDAGEIRFRFPFPDEDHIEPGHFDDHSRSRRIPGLKPPKEDISHGMVQFVARPEGYLVSLPCPEGPEAIDDDGMGVKLKNGVRIGRNGFRGAVHLVQQRLWEGKLVGICECGGCGRKYRLETLEMAEEVAVALRSEADEQNRVAERNGTPGNAEVARRIHEIADRLLAGYIQPLPWLARA
jgi:hypothetical protein